LFTLSLGGIISLFLQEQKTAIYFITIVFLLTFFNLGISFFFTNKPEIQRNRILKILNIIVFSIIFIGPFLKFVHLPGANVFIIFGGFSLAFLIGPIAFMSKYEKWKYYSRSPGISIFLSLTDLIGKAGLILGIIFKIMHWPAADEFLFIGVFFFLVSYLLWNREFQKEVVLRKEAEDKLIQSNDELRQQKNLIEEQNEELKQLNEEISTQNEEINFQKDELQKQKQNITDSIRYASKIQLAILPSEDIVKQHFPEYFVLFRPCDIVSGDFYWFKQIKNFLFVCAADCTGHGVPGAFMSVLGVSLLSEIVGKRDVNPPNMILNELRKRIKKSLHQTGERGEQQDGMDIAFCMIDLETKQVQFSGAYNPLYLFRNNELIEYKADRMPIGVHPKDNIEFTNHEIQLQNDDTIYLFSDGYVSQFGGEKDEKFKTKRFSELISLIANKPMNEQHDILNHTIDSWRGNRHQTDDICVIGIKLIQ